MADYIELLKLDLTKGYSKSDLERLIGLPQNSLSGVLKGDKKLSPKSELKIDIWEASDKPDPLKLHFVKKQVKENKVSEKSDEDIKRDATKKNDKENEKKDKSETKTPPTDSKPERLKGETALEYKIRMMES